MFKGDCFCCDYCEGEKFLIAKNGARFCVSCGEQYRDSRDLTWTDKPPTEPGWYWNENYPDPVWIGQVADEIAVYDADKKIGFIDDLGGRWSGPLLRPEEE
jgi:hypothetical protein